MWHPVCLEDRLKPEPRYKPGKIIGGRYRVHAVKMGGMGEVYLCLDLELDEPFALKTFQERYLTDSPWLREAFEKEVSTWIALEKHPNIVRCFYVDILDNQPFMVLEWIPGEEGRGADLRGWLCHGPLDLRLSLEIAIDICRGLAFAQEKQPGLVHRDLKPENILIAQGKIAKVTDFGLADIVEETKLELQATTVETAGRQSLMSWQGIAGTPTYMAPEQWRGEMLDVRTDIYAVGCIIYEVLAGNPPFVADSLDHLRRLHLEAEPPKIAHIKGLSAELNILLDRCLAKRKENRFSAPSDLLQELDAIYQESFEHPPPHRPEPGVFSAFDHNFRGLTFNALKQYKKALVDLNQAIRMDPNYAHFFLLNRSNTYIALKESTKSLEDLNRAIELHPEYAKAYSNRGLLFDDLQQFEMAFADFDRAIELDPSEPSFYSNRGNTYKDIKQFEKALADFNHAIELNPYDATIYTNRGLTYVDLQQFERALADFSQSIETDPYYAKAYASRGMVFDELRQFDRALADFNRAIERNPSEAEFYSNRSVTYKNIHQLENALTDLNQAIELDSNSVEIYSNRGSVYAALGQYDLASADYEHGIRLNPNNARIHYNRANTHRELKQYERALLDYNTAIELDEKLAQAFTNRAALYYRLENFEQAIVDYTRAIELRPDLVEANIGLGIILGNQGMYKEALPYFEKAAQLGHPQGKQYASIVRRKLGRE